VMITGESADSGDSGVVQLEHAMQKTTHKGLCYYGVALPRGTSKCGCKTATPATPE